MPNNSLIKPGSALSEGKDYLLVSLFHRAKEFLEVHAGAFDFFHSIHLCELNVLSIFSVRLLCYRYFTFIIWKMKRCWIIWGKLSKEEVSILPKNEQKHAYIRKTLKYYHAIVLLLLLNYYCIITICCL